MNLVDYGWVSDEGNLISWENGMKWLSKAIVSDNNEADKQELKAVLDEHLAAGFAHPQSSIRQVAVFYSLCWKRMDLLSDNWEQIGSVDMRRYLNDALSRMYSNYPTMVTDFSIFLDKRAEVCLRKVSALVVERRPEQEVLDSIQRGLLTGVTATAGQSIQIIHELVDLVGMDPYSFRPLLEPFFVKGCTEFRAAVFREDWHWCHNFLEIVEPGREIFMLYDLGEDLRRSFRGFFFCAPTTSFEDAFVYLLRWRFPEILRDYIQQTRDPALTTLLASVTVSYLELDSSAAPDYEELFDFLHEHGWEELYSFFLLLEGETVSSPVLEEHFEQALFLSNPVSLYMDQKETLFSVCRGMELMISDLPSPPPVMKQLRQRFLEAVWDTAVTSGRHVIWRRALTMLSELSQRCRDPFIESEFFLPLMKEGLFSTSSMISREIIGFASEDTRLTAVLHDWAGDEITQKELVDDLRSDDRSRRITALNKLASIYLRLDVRSAYLAKKLTAFREEVMPEQDDGLYLPLGALKLVERMMEKLGS